MNKSSLKLQRICLAAVVAALYTVLTLMLPFLSYGPIQIRFSEALTILPFLFPETVPGLAIGCFLSNLIGSPYPLDWVFGTLATLVAALWTSRCRSKWFAPLPPVIANAVIVGLEIAISTADFGSQAFWISWGWNGITVGFGELIACYILGQLLLALLPKLAYIRKFIPEKRLELVSRQNA